MRCLYENVLDIEDIKYHLLNIYIYKLHIRIVYLNYVYMVKSNIAYKIDNKICITE